MRTKDEEKRRALFEATIKVVNELGFASSSVAKIAKEAGVSQSTLYIYHENKEQLLVATYMEIKREMASVLGGPFDDSAPVREVLRKVWLALLNYAFDSPSRYRYAEQFSNSPYVDLADREELERHFCPLIAVFDRGISYGLIKDVAQDFLTVFLFSPIPALVNAWRRKGEEMTPADMETAFAIAWDAIKA